VNVSGCLAEIERKQEEGRFVHREEKEGRESVGLCILLAVITIAYKMRCNGATCCILQECI